MFSFESNLALKNVKLGRTPLLTFVLIQNVKSPEFSPFVQSFKGHDPDNIEGPHELKPAQRDNFSSTFGGCWES